MWTAPPLVGSANGRSANRRQAPVRRERCPELADLQGAAAVGRDHDARLVGDMLWVPETRFGLSRGRFVLVDQPSEDVSASDAVKGGDRSRLGFAGVWRSLVEGAVGAMRVVVLDVGREDSFEVAAVEDRESIEALAADAADPQLHVRVRLGCAHGCSDDPDRFGPEHLVEGGGELAVAVVDQEPDRRRPIGDGLDDVARLLGCPLPRSGSRSPHPDRSSVWRAR
jgi:hypothetical protein